MIQLINRAIKENGKGEITPSVMRNVLISMINNYPEVPVIPSVPVVIDRLDSTSSSDALSARQGNELNGKITELEDKVDSLPDIPDVPDVIDNLTSTSDKDALSANQGRVLLAMINGGTGMNYQKITSAAYNAAYQAGTLSSNILYIIVG